MSDDDTNKCGFRYLKRRRRFSKTSTASLFIPLNSAWQFAVIWGVWQIGDKF